MKGYGGCPMAKDELTGNMPTEHLLSYFDERKIDLGINRDAFLNSMSIVPEVFNGRE